MKAEIEKLRSLPTPRWSVIGCVAAVALTAAVIAVRGTRAPLEAVELATAPTFLASVIVASWLVGLEYSQRTLQRAMTADPRRVRFAARKLIVSAAFAGVLTTAAYLLAMAVMPALAERSNESLPISDVVRVAVSTVFGNVVLALLATSLTLVARSFAGGITLSLVFVLVIDTAIAAWRPMRGHTLGGALEKVSAAITDTGDDKLLVPLATVALWLAIVAAGGVLRFARSEF